MNINAYPTISENHPVITGHQCAGVIVEVGKNLTGKYKKGQRFVLQPAMGLPSGYSAGYSYEYFGGNATYMIIPEIAINLGCVLPYHGSYFAAASLAEPMCCIIGAYHANYCTPRNMFISIAWASNLAAILHCWRVQVRWALALSITPLTAAYNRRGWWWSISTTNVWRRYRSCCRWNWRPVKALSWCM
ncbi:alcohol dehydrogenase catalytic domain-containing protein [Escherichia coli]